ncbi:glutathione S-transferase family protein [Shewanella eurypsychrophilus]|uniref:Glutathione S-transferase family protein n=1 Tax=Shewanella eurypsychrophilus TaxID=2593656 RepID=A0ABX6VBF1_9GAMM|nr:MULTISPECIES: glutathione S-transferase family protein [Shewanella]QFU24140.1 glutathione S-transferase family protein [Shewanella sp. YLB-09]QPG59347.1 glutathione S-transferase family protein [Shewanella eurypsychrophilus]
MIKLISFKICPFVQRVTAVLVAKKIPFEVEYINLKDKPEWFLDLAPNGQVPVMVTQSGTALFESDAIIEYIEDEYGPLEKGVSNEQRAKDRAWSYLGSKHYLVQCGTMRSKDRETFIKRSENLITAFAKVEAQLSGKTQFFKSDELSNVDIAWVPLLHRAALVKKYTDYDFLCGLPKAQSWQQNVLASLAIDTTVSEDFEPLFNNFYLTDGFLANSDTKRIAS